MKRVVNLYCLLCCLLMPLCLCANPYLPITYVGIDQGLSNNSVRSIYQDKRGAMWFGSFDGLNRFDGYQFKIFRNEAGDTASLVHNYITAISGDSRGNLWVGTRQGASFCDGVFLHFTTLLFRASPEQSPQKLQDVVRTLAATPEDGVLIGTESLGLLRCRRQEKVAVPLPLQTDGRVLTRYSVRSIQYSDKGSAWVFVQHVGLCELLPGSERLVLRYPIPASVVNMAMRNGQLWLCADAWLACYDIRTGTYRQVFNLAEQFKGASPVVSMMISQTGVIWMGRNGDGIITYHIATGATSSLQSGDFKNMLSSSAVHAIYEDKDGRTWIGTDRGGINLIDPHKNRFQLIQHDPADARSLNSNLVQAFYEAPSGDIWIGSDDKGITIWNRNTQHFSVLQHDANNPASLSQNSVRTITEDRNHTIWVATWLGGVNRYLPASNSFKKYLFNEAGDSRFQAIHTVYADHNNTVWAGTLRQGDDYGALYQYNRGQDAFVIFDASLSDLFTIKEDRQGRLWGGNLDHLVLIDRDVKRHRFFTIGFPVWDICEDARGDLWIATEGGGLFQFDTRQLKVVQRYTTANGLPSNSVMRIINNGDGNLWISTYHGLTRMDVAHKTFVSYYQSDGLQSNQFQYNAALKLRSGELLFGGVKGFNLFNPAHITPVQGFPRLLYTGITVNAEALEANTGYVAAADSSGIQAIEVPYSKAMLSVGFTALEYSSPQKITYAYYLDGWDSKWNYTTDLRTATYMHLGEGSYVLRIKCTNIEGAWNPQQLTLRVTVLPPWYRTWWSYMLYLLAIAGVLYIYYTYKIRQNRLRFALAKQQMLNEAEKEIHEKRLSFFTNISHEFRTPLTLIINPARELLQQNGADEQKVGDRLQVIYRNARRLLSLVDQLLLFRKAESETDRLHAAALNVYQVCREVYLSFVQQAKAQQIDYTFSIDDESLELYADKEKLEIILYNLISNALKYTPAGGKVMLNITQTENSVELAVADNGQGIPPAVGERLFQKFYQAEGQGIRKPGFGIGLYLVKHFTNLHRGEVHYSSVPEKGTVFTVKLLKGAAHLLPEEMNNTDKTSLSLLNELSVSAVQEPGLPEPAAPEPEVPDAMSAPLVTEQKTMVVADDDQAIRDYLVSLFAASFKVYAASSGEAALQLAKKHQPDIILSDIKMEGISGVDLCCTIKEDPLTSHIPVILLTGTSSESLQLQGIEGGADDYITKPFDATLLIARVNSLIKNRSQLQQYFYGQITHSSQPGKVSEEYKAFLDKCIAVVEAHLDDENFTVKHFITEMGMSRSSLFRKVKEVSGLSMNVFIRFIRLRKAAEILITTSHNVNETAALVGIIDVQYFREQFTAVFGIRPSEYIKKYRKQFDGRYKLNRDSFKS